MFKDLPAIALIIASFITMFAASVINNWLTGLELQRLHVEIRKVEAAVEENQGIIEASKAVSEQNRRLLERYSKMIDSK